MFSLSALLIVLCARGATGDPMGVAFNCELDAAFREIYYELLGGEEGVTYTVNAVASGCIKLTEAPPDLTGENDTNDVSIECTCEGPGSVTLTLKKNGETIGSCTMCIENDDEQNMSLTDCSTVAACCLPGGTCLEDIPPENCGLLGGIAGPDGSTCADIECSAAIPTLTEWGMIIMFVVMAAGIIWFVVRRRRRMAIV